LSEESPLSLTNGPWVPSSFHSRLQHLTRRPTLSADQPVHLASARQLGGIKVLHREGNIHSDGFVRLKLNTKVFGSVNHALFSAPIWIAVNKICNNIKQTIFNRIELHVNFSVLAALRPPI